jgi:hypothetical protein
VVPEQQSCYQLRDDLTAVTRACLLGRLSLGQPDALNLMASSMEERYSEGTKPNDSPRYVAAGWHQFTLEVDESLVRDPLGTADTIVPDAKLLVP